MKGKMNQPTYATMFSGGGLADCGFNAAGMRGLWAIESEAPIAGVYRVNHPDHDCITAFVEDVDYSTLPVPDHLHVSPSCRNASRANTGGEECEADRTAAAAVCRAIKALRPQTFSLENVWRYRTFESLRMILRALDEYGYFVHYAHLNSADWGVPQTRERLILRASLRPLPLFLPTHARDSSGKTGALFGDLAPWVGWYEAIEDLIPTLPETRFAEWQLRRLPENLTTVLVSNAATERCDGMRTGDELALTVMAAGGRSGNRPTAFICDGQNGSRSNSYTTRDHDEPCFTICAGSGNKGPLRAFIVDGRNTRTTNDEAATLRAGTEPCFTVTATDAAGKHRAFVTDRTSAQLDLINVPRERDLSWLSQGRVVKMTERALARFQSAPDSYLLPASKQLAGTIIGNGFPPLWAQRVVENLYPRSTK